MDPSPLRTGSPYRVAVMTFGPLVTAEWLDDHLGDDDLVVVDVRWSVADGAKRTDYEAGHIPGAVFADLDVDLSGPSSPATGRHPLPTAIAFADALGRLGIGDITRVVAYDDAGGIIAARLWWMLDILGRDVAVLDGGIQVWDGKLSTVGQKPNEASFTARPWPVGRCISIDALHSMLDGDVVVLDARSVDRYAHGAEIDPRPGHIPGALSAPATDNLRDGRWARPGALNEHYRSLGAEGENVIAYCGSGVTACAALLGRRLAGLPEGRLYVGSWSQWGSDPDRPATEGPTA